MKIPTYTVLGLFGAFEALSFSTKLLRVQWFFCKILWIFKRWKTDWIFFPKFREKSKIGVTSSQSGVFPLHCVTQKSCLRFMANFWQIVVMVLWCYINTQTTNEIRVCSSERTWRERRSHGPNTVEVLWEIMYFWPSPSSWTTQKSDLLCQFTHINKCWLETHRSDCCMLRQRGCWETLPRISDTFCCVVC